METLLILGAINILAIFIVWIISRKRDTGTSASQEEFTDLEVKYKQCEERLKDFENNLIRTEEQLSAREEKIEELHSKATYNEKQEQERQAQLLDLNKVNSRLTSECSSYKSKTEELQLKVSDYEKIIDDKSSQLQEKIKTNATLTEQLSSKNSKITELQDSVNEYKESCDNQRLRIESLTETNASQEEQLNSRDKKIGELLQSIEELKGSEELLEQRLKTQFELISNKIIEESRTKVSQFNAENISTLMKPFETEIKAFKEQINLANKEQTKERTELEAKINQMVSISQDMSAEARNLSNALRGNNKTAGNWGETILENILQNSGLTVGKEGYELQEMLRDAEGNAYRNDTGRKMIPDAIVHFPDNRNVIIDSKVSISAYTDYCNAENEDDKRLYLKRHLASIKVHIDELNVKSYENYVDGSLDFVMMFIPNDFAAMVALGEDLNLWQNAYNKKILIISPTNLITSLKIVSDLWSREKQHQNIENILERGRLLFDKCCGFVDSFKKIGEGLQSATKIYDGAFTQLSGNGGILRQAELLEKTGIKSKKSLTLRSDEAKEGVELQIILDENSDK